MATHRVSRGRESQKFAAEYLKPIFPNAASIAASLPGKDVLNTPGFDFEVKARRDFKPTEASKQMSKRNGEEFHACIMRPDGYGEARVGEWLVFMTFAEFRDLLYGYIHQDSSVSREDFDGHLDDAYWI